MPRTTPSCAAKSRDRHRSYGQVPPRVPPLRYTPVGMTTARRRSSPRRPGVCTFARMMRCAGALAALTVALSTFAADELPAPEEGLPLEIEPPLLIPNRTAD